jgi:hypothetical protein
MLLWNRTFHSPSVEWGYFDVFSHHLFLTLGNQNRNRNLIPFIPSAGIVLKIEGWNIPPSLPPRLTSPTSSNYPLCSTLRQASTLSRFPSNHSIREITLQLRMIVNPTQAVPNGYRPFIREHFLKCYCWWNGKETRNYFSCMVASYFCIQMQYKRT